jgi:hypothetical protein
MAYEHKEGSGSLFPNRKKEPGSKQPDWRGDVLLNGVLMEIAGWSKEGANGSFLSLAVKPKQERPQQQQGNYEAQRIASEPKRHAPDRISSGPAQPSRKIGGNLDDEIPFAPEWR